MTTLIDRMIKFLEEFFCTDKNLIVLVLFVIAIYSLYLNIPDVEKIINNIISGLLGMAVGIKITNGSNKGGV